MNATIQLDAAKLRAVSLFSATKDIRYYLNGVYVEASATETRVAATDGHVLAVVRSDEVNGMAACPEISLIVPGAVIASALKLLEKDDKHLSLFLDDGKWTMVANGARLPFEPIDGKFPDYRRVIPTKEPEGIAAQFNPELLMRFKKAAKALGAKFSPIVHHDIPEHSALVTIPSFPDFAGVIMPLRTDKADMFRPSWMANKLVTSDAQEVAA